MIFKCMLRVAGSIRHRCRCLVAKIQNMPFKFICDREIVSATVVELKSCEVQNNPLPLNVSSRDDLSRDVVANFDYSFWDVPQKKIKPAYIVEIENCFLLRYKNGYGDQFFSVIMDSGQVVRSPQLSFGSELRSVWKGVNSGEIPVEVLPDAMSVLGNWMRNYYHWFVDYLPRITTTLSEGSEGNLLLPDLRELPPFVAESLSALNLKVFQLNPNVSAWRIGRLQIFQDSLARVDCFKNYRNYLGRLGSKASRRGKKIFISRRGATRRVVCNVDQVESVLLERGWGIVQMERLGFVEQVELMRQCSAVAGVHGAGLANIVFAPSGTHVLEILLKERPNPDYYALASTCGHSYWFMEGRSMGNRRDVAYDNIVVDVDLLRELLDEMESCLLRDFPLLELCE